MCFCRARKDGQTTATRVSAGSFSVFETVSEMKHVVDFHSFLKTQDAITEHSEKAATVLRVRLQIMG